MWSRLARVMAVAALAIVPSLLPLTTLPASAASWSAASPRLLSPAAQGDPCPEPNDSFQNACYLGPNADAVGYISSARDVDAYRIEVLDFNVDVHVEMPTMPAAYKLYLADWNGDEIATSVSNGSGGQVIDTTVDIPGAYYIFVHSEAGGFSAGRPYELFRALTYPGSKIPDILFTSEFREGSRQATTGETQYAVHTEEGGRYTIAMKISGVPDDPSQAFWTGFGPELTDFTMTLDARVVNQVDAGFQVFFRHVDDGNTYRLGVDTKDGQVLMMKTINGQAAANTGWQPSAAVDTTGGVNRVVIRCFEDQIRVNVNGVDVFDLRDSALRKGRIGIGAIAFGAPPVVSFDNIIITTPTEG
jgi:hypothetical protein